MERTFWVVRHLKTGALMPAMDRGTTHWEPQVSKKAPKLFLTERGAQSSIEWWLKGVTTVNRTGGWSGLEYDDHEDWKTIPVADRDAGDLVIEEVNLIFRGGHD